MHRLFIDIPLPLSTENAVLSAKEIIELISSKSFALMDLGAEKINYRLGHDEDRQRSNYLLMDESGHVSNKKLTIMLDNKLTTETES